MEPTKKIIVYVWFTSLFLTLFFWLKQGFVLLQTFDVGSITLFVARLFGLLSAFFVLTQFMLIGRIGWIESVWGQDSLARIHRKIGKYVLYSILLHTVFVVWSYSISTGFNILAQLLDFFAHYEDTLQGFVAALLFILIALLSIFFKRLKLNYEVWYFIHLMVYVAILFAWGHQLKLGGTLQNQLASVYWITLYVFVAVNFLYFRFFRILFYFYKHNFYVSKVVSERGNATSIYISGKNMKNFARQSGQFAIFRFLDPHRFWQAHPFSLSWGDNNLDLRITAKDSGDFTHNLNSLKKGTYVLVDGMLGHFTLNPQKKNKVLLIAGGIGITPIRALIEKLPANNETVLLWSAKTSDEFTLKEEVLEIAKKTNTKVNFFVTEAAPKESYENKGRITEEDIKKFVKDLGNREVYICGPLPFMLGMKEILKSLGVYEGVIHFEEFSLH